MKQLLITYDPKDIDLFTYLENEFNNRHICARLTELDASPSVMIEPDAVGLLATFVDAVNGTTNVIDAVNDVIDAVNKKDKNAPVTLQDIARFGHFWHEVGAIYSRACTLLKRKPKITFPALDVKTP